MSNRDLGCFPTMHASLLIAILILLYLPAKKPTISFAVVENILLYGIWVRAGFWTVVSLVDNQGQGLLSSLAL